MIQYDPASAEEIEIFMANRQEYDAWVKERMKKRYNFTFVKGDIVKEGIVWEQNINMVCVCSQTDEYFEFDWRVNRLKK